MEIRWRKTVSPIILVVLWELLIRAKVINALFLSAPSSIAKAGWGLLVNGELVTHTLISISRSLTGFFIGSSLAVIVGIFIGWKRHVEDILEPPIELLRSLPPVSLISVALLWFGIGNGLALFIISWACFFPAYINTIEGVKGVDLQLVRAALTLRASQKNILFKVIIPASLPMIFAGLRTALGTALMGVIISEMVGARSGLGFLILESERYYLVDKMFVGIATISVVGFLLGRLLLAIEHKVIAWHREMSMTYRKKSWRKLVRN